MMRIKGLSVEQKLVDARKTESSMIFWLIKCEKRRENVL
jgi:hypothetical protein